MAADEQRDELVAHVTVGGRSALGVALLEQQGEHRVVAARVLAPARDDGADGPTAPGACSAYIVVDEPDALCARMRAGGAEVTVELHDTDYGSRDFAIRDPEGNRWYFGTYRGAPRAP